MKNINRNHILKLSFIAILIIFSTAIAGEVDKLELKNLHGKWEGVGEFILPVVHSKVAIKGKADFVYDEETQRLRTTLIGEKFMFRYSDSGYLWIDPVTDTISWEVWDNSGRHALYHGEVEGNKVSGMRLRKKDVYRVMVEQVTTDSIEFKLTITEPDGDSYDKAAFHLWRVK